jgi:hypothetical protein
MAEIGQLRFASIGVQECVSSLEAAAVWLFKMFPKDIDGIQIDWDADANHHEVNDSHEIQFYIRDLLDKINSRLGGKIE